MAYNGFSKAVTAALLFKASSSFDAAVTKPGCNVSSLLSAIGAQGLAKLWHQLTVFAWTVSLSQVCLYLDALLLCCKYSDGLLHHRICYRVCEYSTMYLL